ncbi:MAG TPA: hypothetical protein VN716_00530 [Vicinamibacterales bacterium]|jgi:hypothetical protein|nr:hypothetical protein [Vicinamibacterales bacterium]
MSSAIRGGVSSLWHDERGEEQVNYLFIVATVVLPLIVVTWMMWSILLYYFQLEALIVDFPLF